MVPETPEPSGCLTEIEKPLLPCRRDDKYFANDEMRNRTIDRADAIS